MGDHALLEKWQQRVDSKLGTTDWLTIDQQRIDNFADTTLDHQVIHVDPEAPATKELGGTIAHGFLTLSMLSYLGAQLTRPLNENRTVLNYGLNRVRFLTPVASGSRVRLHMTVKSVEEKPRGVLITYSSEVEIDGAVKPALMAEQLALILY
ncbi:hypothetical protein AB833_30545 [Chromatiales bacterium (ex Bugula neritina AB1)]|nr:hypothetical protein AB833_30545 [Chromatiales bacterium (ex Bugula neritina AB1)]